MENGLIYGDYAKMERQLDKIAKSYDTGIIIEKKGIDSYDNFPEHILNDPDYPLFQRAKSHGLDSDSGSKEIKSFLSPRRI